jgi:hypothetical protein
VLRQYKFYLAFENAHVEDYVSEKVYEGIIAGTLPVYRGTPNIASFLPEQSFIDANNLSPKALAALLLDLASDESKYNAYFNFKNEPLKSSFVRIANQSYCHPSALCRLCQYYDEHFAHTS